MRSIHYNHHVFFGLTWEVFIFSKSNLQQLRSRKRFVIVHSRRVLLYRRILLSMKFTVFFLWNSLFSYLKIPTSRKTPTSRSNQTFTRMYFQPLAAKAALASPPAGPCTSISSQKFCEDKVPESIQGGKYHFSTPAEGVEEKSSTMHRKHWKNATAEETEVTYTIPYP